jgi:diguanylate cyclase (GGDEF)-like protein
MVESGERRGESAAAEKSGQDVFDETSLLRHPRSVVALVIASLLGVGTLVASYWVRETIREAGELRLRRALERAAVFIEERSQAYAQIVRGTGALFRASEDITVLEFRDYAESLRLSRNYPGLLGLGFAERVDRESLVEWLEEARSELPTLELKGIGTAPEFAINRFIEPMAFNQPAIGFNALGESVRAEALAAARARDDLASTGRIQLLQDPAGGPGFSLYLPVVMAGNELAGWVFGSVRARDLVDGVQAAAGASVVLRVSDESDEAPFLGQHEPIHGFALGARFVDRTFRIEGQPGPGFYSLSELVGPWAVLFLGLAATTLSYFLIDSLRRVEARSHALATRMTSALRRRERELEMANAELERLARTDALTGLANRRVFDERLLEEIARAGRNRAPLCLLLLDVDHFKAYNDTYGHQGGDECLRRIGESLRGTVRRAGEVVARYGGEEMALLLPASDERAGTVVAERVRAAVEQLAIPHEKNSHQLVTISLGVACFHPGGARDASAAGLAAAASTLIAQADAALYRAKGGGRNRVEMAAA